MRLFNKVAKDFCLGISLLLGVCASSFATIQTANDAFIEGEYREAIGLYSALVDTDALAVVGLSRSYVITGDYDAAESVCRGALTRFPKSIAITTQLAEVLFVAGKSDQALEVLSELVARADFSAAQNTLRALVIYGDYLKFRGQHDDAIAYLSLAKTQFNGQMNITAEDAALIAKASWLLGDYQEANRLFREATRLDNKNAEAHLWWGDLFAEKYNRAEALQSYQEVLQFNAQHPVALVGVATMSRETKPLERALYANPRSAAVFIAHAEIALQKQKYTEARSYLNAALANNAEAMEALAALAAIAELQNNRDEFVQMEKRALQLRPNNGEFYTKIAEVLSNDYMFDEAVEYASKAISVEPEYWQAQTVLGMNLIRLGKEDEGKKILEFAFEKDPFNIWTSNMLKVFDTLDEYVTMKTDHFDVRMSKSDAVVLWPYMKTLLDEAWQTLTKKYAFTPEVPVLIEVFEKREDFAVRSVGLPDIGPLVGICFGKVITLISPDTLSANWQEIVWHEFVHVITLQMSNNRIPRWLSEGISVYEEFQGRPEWGRRQELDIARALEQKKFFPIDRIDDAFLLAQSDDDLNLAYLQSYLVVDFIVEQYGFDAIKKLLSAYKDEYRLDVVLTKAVERSPKQFDEGFSGWIEERMAQVDVHVDEDDMADDGAAHGHGVRSNSSALLAEQYSVESLKRYMLDRIEKQPRDFQAYLQLGIVLFKDEDFAAAEKYLLTAQEILPFYTGYPSPPLILSQLYEETGEEEKRLAMLKYLVKYHQHDVDSTLFLARDAIEKGDLAQAEYYFLRAIAVDPYRLDVHKDYALLAEKTANTSVSVREYEILTRLDTTDPVTAYTKLAGAYLKDGKKVQAKQSSLRALEMAPTFAPAQKVLLEAVGE